MPAHPAGPELPRLIAAPDGIVPEMVHPELTGVIAGTAPDILLAERDLIIHAVINENLVGFPDVDEGRMGDLPIVRRDIRVPFFGQFAETTVDPIQACPAADAKDCGRFRNTHSRPGSHQGDPLADARKILFVSMAETSTTACTDGFIHSSVHRSGPCSMHAMPGTVQTEYRRLYR